MTTPSHRDTGRAKLPALPRTNAQDPSLRSWMNAVTERLEVREGSRGNPWERALTLRDLTKATGGLVQIYGSGGARPDGMTGGIDIGNGFTASINIERFIDSIKNSRLYKDLIKRLDDPTRFDHLASEIREVLLRSIADEAAQRGADIRITETKIQDLSQSLAMYVRETTAALYGNSAGIRVLEAAHATQTQATATKITQLEVNLDNYYDDFSAGQAMLEEQMLVQASHTDGLLSQYTLKVQAGGALAGFGLAAQEVNGIPSSAFIIRADKFAIVTPNYNGGFSANPDLDTVPFGVDKDGIYLNTNVYVRGLMRVDTAGKTLIDGLRGSLDLNAGSGAWNDTAARQAIWSALGKPGSAPNNNHLVIGDTVTMGTAPSVTTKQWMGSSWQIPGMVINGSLLVNGSVAATKIDTRGLTIKDDNGNVILGSGAASQAWIQQHFGALATQNSVSTNQVNGLGALATKNSVTTGEVSGLGSMATKDSAVIGSTVTLPNGAVLKTEDFVNTLSKINGSNISNFMDVAAIGSAYIGNAAVGTLKIAGESVTKVRSAQASWSATFPKSGQVQLWSGQFSTPAAAGNSTLTIILSTPVYANSEVSVAIGISVLVNGTEVASVAGTSDANSRAASLTCSGAITVAPGEHTISVRGYTIAPWNDDKDLNGLINLVIFGAFR